MFFYGQSSHTISGILTDSNGEVVPFINVLLLQSNDSTFVKGTITLDNGTYQLENIKPGKYFIMGSMVGYQSAYSQSFDLNGDYKVEHLILSEGETLDEVVVKATKPLYQQKVDRMVINVANSIVSAGGSALEILERSPGVLVDRQGSSISVVGKSGVVVMINGKRSYLPASAVVQFLESMSSDNIESIELITTPPANLDAEGNAGYINIVMKQNLDIGFNGSYSLSVGYGNGETSSDNISFNYRKDKINIFGNYSFLLDGRETYWSTNREYMQDNNLLTTSTVTNRDPTQRNHNIRLGLDYQITKKTITGLLFNTYDTKWTMDAFNESVDTENGNVTSYVELLNYELNQWKHFGVNYNIKHNFTGDKFISIDFDYLYYKDNNPTDYTNSFFDENKVFTRTALLRSSKITPLKTWVSKLDYSNKINDKFKFELGVKGTLSNFENEVSVEDFVNNNWVIDPSLTNKSNLDEKILATYSALDYQLNDKISLKIGLRYEFTDSQLDTDTKGKVVDRQYGILFPSVFLNKKFTDDLIMNLSYSKRITRPTFNDLAPFVLFVDPNTFISGNSSLQPAISNSFKYDLNYKSYILSFQYTNEDSSIAQFQERIDEETDRLIFEASNLEFTKTFSTTIGLPLRFNDWWKSQNNLIYIKQKVNALYNGDPIEIKLGNFSVNSTHSFNFTEAFLLKLQLFILDQVFLELHYIMRFIVLI